ncbi:uncharacterized protein MONBRDRAFT_32310 [Monosiga brevicollis MX1]|uniref:Pre-mRNA-splicing factor ISY1 n=1 Tax=Monosiga brevicollis TaxID=81824 RepID=A9UYQ4_MONBE|nr:uncharacterized protein MONBRDRAFT_32310 [Monosiga brevicollis MX1]EDQ89646.1 predicted protein [Monosiga brevicollis MX1]|eukprot:XP_001745675.1 hypothetical protein [Monosiga brevicollis MX1]
MKWDGHGGESHIATLTPHHNAQRSLLNRWVAGKMNEVNPKKQRPYHSKECHDLHDAEKFRRDIIYEFSQGLQKIQNAGLGEYRLRDLNDELNRLLREKKHWEYRIVELGGADYTQTNQRFLDSEGRMVQGNFGYKYFGAARELPGVRELIAPKTMAAAVEAWKASAARRQREEVEGTGSSMAVDEDEEADGIAEVAARAAAERAARELEQASHPVVPSQKDIEQLLLRRRKEMLLKQYASDALVQDEQKTATLSGRA